MQFGHKFDDLGVDMVHSIDFRKLEVIFLYAPLTEFGEGLLDFGTVVRLVRIFADRHAIVSNEHTVVHRT